MIANARMYAVTPAMAERWGDLLRAVFAAAGVPAAGVPVAGVPAAGASAAFTVLEHAAPAPLEELWARSDQAAVFMCGLPFALSTTRRPLPVVAPVPAPAAYAGQPRYWSRFVVNADSPHRRIEDTFGGRLALTVPGSQSGCAAALIFLQTFAGPTPLFETLIAPTITPMGALGAVIRGEADLAPIDSYAFALLDHDRPDLTAQARVVADTAPTPIPPLVASPGTLTPAELEALVAAFLDAHRRPSTRGLMDAVLLCRFVRPPVGSYDPLRARYEATLRHWRSQPLARIVDPAFAALLDGAFVP